MAAAMGIAGRMFRRKDGATVGTGLNAAEVCSTDATGDRVVPPPQRSEDGAPERSSVRTTHQQQGQPHDGEQLDNIVSTDDLVAFLESLTEDGDQVRLVAVL